MIKASTVGQAISNSIHHKYWRVLIKSPKGEHCNHLKLAETLWQEVSETILQILYRMHS